MKFSWIDVERAHHPVAELCEALDVSGAGFYAWRTRPESRHAIADKKLVVHVHAAYRVGRTFCGSPRVHAT